MAWLAEQGRGFAVGSARVPIVPGAILFDLLNGGDKNWGRFPPYRDLGYAARAAAAGRDFALGSAGAGLGATTGNLKGGARLGVGHDAGGVTVGGARGRQCGRQRRHWRRAVVLGRPVRADGEFGGHGHATVVSPLPCMN